MCSCADSDYAAEMYQESRRMGHISEEDDDMEEGTDTASNTTSPANINSSDDVVTPNVTCGGTCSSNAQCGNGCVCTTRKEQYLPAQGTVKFFAACILSMASNPKREERKPCPCNNTYVSHACCGAMDGLVYENVAHNLGVL